MSDFIREVDEDYRRDRVINFFTKNQGPLIALALAIILGTAGYRIYLYYQGQAAETTNTRYEAAMQLVRDGKSAEAQAAFDKIQSDAPAGYAMLSRLQAVEALATRDPSAAATGFDSIANDGGIEASLRDVARIRGAMIRIDIEDPKAFEKRYAPLAVQGFAFHSSLEELLALAAFKRNDTDAAGRWLDQIVIDPQAPSALRSRAEAFLGLVAAGPAEAGTPAPARPLLEAPPPIAPAPASPAPTATPSSAPAGATPPAVRTVAPTPSTTSTSSAPPSSPSAPAPVH